MMKIQTIKKGKHFVRFWDRFSLPNTTKTEERVDIRMSGPGMRYDYGDADQADWNKLPGGKYFDLYRPHGKTVMMGWRYNIELDAIEITPYYHNIEHTDGYKAVGSVPGYYREDNILTIPIVDDAAHIGLYYSINGGAFELDFYDLKNSDNIRSDSVEFEQIGALHTVSNAYFGGNKTAKGRIKFEVMIFLNADFPRPDKKYKNV